MLEKSEDRMVFDRQEKGESDADNKVAVVKESSTIGDTAIFPVFDLSKEPPPDSVPLRSSVALDRWYLRSMNAEALRHGEQVKMIDPEPSIFNGRYEIDVLRQLEGCMPRTPAHKVKWASKAIRAAVAREDPVMMGWEKTDEKRDELQQVSTSEDEDDTHQGGVTILITSPRPEDRVVQPPPGLSAQKALGFMKFVTTHTSRKGDKSRVNAGGRIVPRGPNSPPMMLFPPPSKDYVDFVYGLTQFISDDEEKVRFVNQRLMPPREQKERMREVRRMADNNEPLDSYVGGIPYNLLPGSTWVPPPPRPVAQNLANAEAEMNKQNNFLTAVTSEGSENTPSASMNPKNTRSGGQPMVGQSTSLTELGEFARKGPHSFEGQKYWGNPGSSQATNRSARLSQKTDQQAKLPQIVGFAEDGAPLASHQGRIYRMMWNGAQEVLGPATGDFRQYQSLAQSVAQPGQQPAIQSLNQAMAQSMNQPMLQQLNQPMAPHFRFPSGNNAPEFNLQYQTMIATQYDGPNQTTGSMQHSGPAQQMPHKRSTASAQPMELTGRRQTRANSVYGPYQNESGHTQHQYGPGQHQPSLYGPASAVVGDSSAATQSNANFGPAPSYFAPSNQSVGQGPSHQPTQANHAPHQATLQQLNIQLYYLENALAKLDREYAIKSASINDLRFDLAHAAQRGGLVNSITAVRRNIKDTERAIVVEQSKQLMPHSDQINQASKPVIHDVRGSENSSTGQPASSHLARPFLAQLSKGPGGKSLSPNAPSFVPGGSGFNGQPSALASHRQSLSKLNHQRTDSIATWNTEIMESVDKIDGLADLIDEHSSGRAISSALTNAIANRSSDDSLRPISVYRTESSEEVKKGMQVDISTLNNPNYTKDHPYRSSGESKSSVEGGWKVVDLQNSSGSDETLSQRIRDAYEAKVTEAWKLQKGESEVEFKKDHEARQKVFSRLAAASKDVSGKKFPGIGLGIPKNSEGGLLHEGSEEDLARQHDSTHETSGKETSDPESVAKKILGKKSRARTALKNALAKDTLKKAAPEKTASAKDVLVIEAPAKEALSKENQPPKGSGSSSKRILYKPLDMGQILSPVMDNSKSGKQKSLGKRTAEQAPEEKHVSFVKGAGGMLTSSTDAMSPVNPVEERQMKQSKQMHRYPEGKLRENMDEDSVQAYFDKAFEKRMAEIEGEVIKKLAAAEPDSIAAQLIEVTKALAAAEMREKVQARALDATLPASRPEKSKLPKYGQSGYSYLATDPTTAVQTTPVTQFPVGNPFKSGSSTAFQNQRPMNQFAGANKFSFGDRLSGAVANPSQNSAATTQFLGGDQFGTGSSGPPLARHPSAGLPNAYPGTSQVTPESPSSIRASGRSMASGQDVRVAGMASQGTRNLIPVGSRVGWQPASLFNHPTHTRVSGHPGRPRIADDLFSPLHTEERFDSARAGHFQHMQPQRPW